MTAVSVVVPTHNRLEILRETVGRLLRQELEGEEYEVVVVDDHSSDGTGAWLEEQAGREPRLRPARSPRRGRSSARNAGVAAARGELICFLDDDMWVGPGCVQAHWEAFLAAGPVATVGVGRMRPYSGNAPTLVNRAYDRRLARIDEAMAQYGDDLPCRYLCTGNVSLPRRLFAAGLSFDESFAGYSFEDTELGYRLAGQGVRFRYLPAAYAEHRTDTTVAALLRKREEAGRSAVRFLQQHPEAAEHLEIPFAVPGVATTRRRDGLGKRLVKAAAFSRPAAWALEALVPLAARLRAERTALRLLDWAGYARYARAFRRSAEGCLPPPSLGLRVAGTVLAGVNRLGGRGAGAGAAPRKILVVRRGYVGDVIESTALVGDLRRAYPGAEIVYMTGAAGAQALAGNRNVDRIAPYPAGPGGGFWRALRRLRRERFDLGLCLSHNSRDALLLRLAGVGQAAGFAEPQREFLLDLAVTWDEQELRAGRERYEELLRALGIEPVYRAYDFPAAAAEAAAPSRLLPGWDPAERPLLVLAGGAIRPAPRPTGSGRRSVSRRWWVYWMEQGRRRSH
jgi:GT2 family glycosyltransferase